MKKSRRAATKTAESGSARKSAVRRPDAAGASAEAAPESDPAVRRAPESDRVVATCPGCGTTYDVTNFRPGKKLGCKRCGERFERPAADPRLTKTLKERRARSVASTVEMTKTRAARVRRVDSTLQMTPEELRERFQDRKGP